NVPGLHSAGTGHTLREVFRPRRAVSHRGCFTVLWDVDRLCDSRVGVHDARTVTRISINLLDGGSFGDRSWGTGPCPPWLHGPGVHLNLSSTCLSDLGPRPLARSNLYRSFSNTRRTRGEIYEKKHKPGAAYAHYSHKPEISVDEELARAMPR